MWSDRDDAVGGWTHLLAEVYTRTTLATAACGDTDRDFPSTVISNDGVPSGAVVGWDDGCGWSDHADARLYAYDPDRRRSRRSRAVTLDRSLDPTNTAPRGVWSDGTTWYVADVEDRTVYVYGGENRYGPNRSPEAVDTPAGPDNGISGAR